MSVHQEDEGPYILGSTLSYGDFVIAAMLEAFRRIGQDMFDRIVKDHRRLEELHDAVKALFENDV